MTDSPVKEPHLSFVSAGLKLNGTLTFPYSSSKSPAILFLPGSGKTDRDNNAKQLLINIFPQLIPSITELGFASFRYDKRGVGSSEGDFWTTGLYDLAEDAIAATEYLKTLTEVDPERIYVLGHSEGALLALFLAAKTGLFAGVISLAGPVKTGEQTLIWQTNKISKSITGFQKRLLRLLRVDVVKSVQKNLARIKSTTTDVARIRGQKVNAKWMREFMAYNPSETMSKVNVPVLAITGTNDVQVDPQDLQLLEKLITSDLETHAVEGLTHLLRTDNPNLGLKSYKAQAKKPVDPKVISLIGKWLSKRS